MQLHLPAVSWKPVRQLHFIVNAFKTHTQSMLARCSASKSSASQHTSCKLPGHIACQMYTIQTVQGASRTIVGSNKVDIGGQVGGILSHRLHVLCNCVVRPLLVEGEGQVHHTCRQYLILSLFISTNTMCMPASGDVLLPRTSSVRHGTSSM